MDRVIVAKISNFSSASANSIACHHGTIVHFLIRFQQVRNPRDNHQFHIPLSWNKSSRVPND